jgi:hypothetical protein
LNGEWFVDALGREGVDDLGLEAEISEVVTLLLELSTVCRRPILGISGTGQVRYGRGPEGGGPIEP